MANKTFTTQQIKGFTYSKEAQVNEQTGKSYYPKDIRWDSEVKGLGLRIFQTGAKSFVYNYRTKHGTQRMADFGKFGLLTLDEARKKAKKWAALVLDGKDPLEDRSKERNGDLISDLCAAYIERHAKPNKKSWVEDERRNNLYIIPALGRKQVQEIRKQDIAKLIDDIGRVQNKPYMANRVREQLSKMFALAKTWGFVEDSFANPASRDVGGFEERERSDFIKPEDMPIVKQAIDNELNKVARAVIWLYLLTGKRRNELLEATWDNLDERTKTLKIPQTKNQEPEHLQLSAEAWKIIQEAKSFRVVGNPYIFPGDKSGGHFVNVRKVWERIRKEAAKNGAKGVDKVTIHGLRHTFAVYAVSIGGKDLGTVRSLLNHKSLRVTTVYAKYLAPAKQKALDEQGNMMAQLAKGADQKKKVVKLQK